MDTSPISGVIYYIIQNHTLVNSSVKLYIVLQHSTHFLPAQRFNVREGFRGLNVPEVVPVQV
jgi:hypothetical protein